MTTDRIALMRPINTPILPDALVLGPTGGTHVHVSIPAGTYWSLLAILYSVEQQIQVTFANATVSLTSANDYKIQIATGSHGALALSVSDAFAAITGLATGPAATTHTASVRSPFEWISTYSPYDQVTWTIPQEKVWSGSTALDGNLAGTLMAEYSPTNYDASTIMMSRKVSLAYESAAQIFWKSGGKTSLEAFMLNARSATSHGNADPPATGFFVFEDADIISNKGYWVTGSAYHGILASSNKYQFCTPAVNGTGGIVSSIPAGKTHYSTTFSVRAARPQTSFLGWQAPS